MDNIACTHTNTHAHTHRSIYTVATASLLAPCHSTDRCTDLGLCHTSLCQRWRGLEGHDTVNTQGAKRPPHYHHILPHLAPPSTPCCCAPISTSHWVASDHHTATTVFHRSQNNTAAYHRAGGEVAVNADWPPWQQVKEGHGVQKQKGTERHKR